MTLSRTRCKAHWLGEQSGEDAANGQSITEQKWTRRGEDDLRRRFPHANLVIENRALGGFASQMLVKAAETDLYPLQPDLLIFHV